MNTTTTIRIMPKQLPSGNYQVKFFIDDDIRPKYGYLLVSGTKSAEEVILEIRERMDRMKKSQLDLFRFSSKRQWQDDHSFYLYSA